MRVRVEDGVVVVTDAAKLFTYTSANRLTPDDARRAAETLEWRGDHVSAEMLRRAADAAEAGHDL